MSLPIVKVSKYDLLMNNIPATLATEECLIVLEDTGKVIHWNSQEYTGYKYTGCGGSTGSYGGGGASTAYFSDRIVAERRYTSRKEAIDTYSRMTLKVDGKHTLCLACGRFIHTPKIGKYNDRYCENCGCYIPEMMFGKEQIK